MKIEFHTRTMVLGAILLIATVVLIGSKERKLLDLIFK